ncbi:hypothetical protein CK203_104452 [Vitis vinifera]|uniref:Uncharacterized protein n=2 Tax=Vitis vinifera TaxID=29760 RepID=A0A438DH44_VITVI|nr:hypothetical protein CK203_104452 [Vitis vinifera]
MTAGVPMTSDAGIKRSHNTDRRTLGRFLEFCIEKDKFIAASVVHHRRSLLVLEFVVAIDPPESSLTPESNADDVTPSHMHCLRHFRQPLIRHLLPTLSFTPFLFNARNVQHTSTENIAGEKRESSGGLKGGRKAELALGVITYVAMLGLVCLVYKKRKGNIQRSRYSYSPWEKKKSLCSSILVSCQSVHWFSGDACVTM